MKLNFSMKALLEKYSINSIDCISQNNTYPIWNKTDTAGRTYYGVDSFCGMDKYPVGSEQDLSELEWEGNEVYLDAYSDEEVAHMLRKSIGILAFWKNEMITRYQETSFYLFASYSNGDILILDEGKAPTKSITMRFWADRGENTIIDLSDFDSWDQPAIVEHIKCTF